MTQWQIQQILIWLNVNSNKCWVDQKSFYINYDLTQWHFEQFMIWQMPIITNSDSTKYHFKQMLIWSNDISNEFWLDEYHSNKVWCNLKAVRISKQTLIWLNVNSNKCCFAQKVFYINFDLTQWHFEQFMIWQMPIITNSDSTKNHFKQMLIWSNDIYKEFW